MVVPLKMDRRPGELLGEHHPQQGLHVGGAVEDGPPPGVALQVQQQPALLKGRRGEVQLGQIGEHPAHHGTGAANSLLFKLGIVAVPQPPLLIRGQTQVVNETVQGVIGQHPLAR